MRWEETKKGLLPPSPAWLTCLAKLLNHDDGQNIQVLWEASLAIIRQYSQGSVKLLLEEKGPEIKEECWVQNRH